MAANMYRVGDCVYFETSSTSPYQIRRIEELNKTASGNVEAKVMCFYRRRDLPNPLIQLADKHQNLIMGNKNKFGAVKRKKATGSWTKNFKRAKTAAKNENESENNPFSSEFKKTPEEVTNLNDNDAEVQNVIDNQELMDETPVVKNLNNYDAKDQNVIHNRESVVETPEVTNNKNTSAAETPIEYIIENQDSIDEDPSKKPIHIEGRRVVDFQYLFDQFLQISQHSQVFGCQLNHIVITKEIRHGLSSTLLAHCSMCNTPFRLNTCSTTKDVIDVNHSAVAGIISIGCGLTNFNELAAALNLPSISTSLYEKCHNQLYDWYKFTAEKTMKDAANEEREKAKEKSPTGKPMIPVTADACWSKRSYRTNYSSLSGVGAIIGLNSGKVLHIGVKNKYCVICMRAKGKEKDPPEHVCSINHKGSSTSMEQASIVEGFKQSEEKHNLIYSKLIADGDASTYKKILESRPYTSVIVQKIECSNHLLRNYNGKNMNLAKDTSIPLDERKLLTADRLKRLRVAVKAAVRFRRAQTDSDAIKLLQNDISNSPLHIFGDHSKCESYYCTDEKKKGPNYVPHVPKLMTKLNTNSAFLAYHAKSLLYNLNNNRAEQFNSIVSKYVGGKRINYALKNSYALRCYAAVVSYNTGTPITTLFKTITAKSPSIAVKKFEMRKKKKNSIKKIWKPKRRIDFNNENADYGETCQKPDMTSEEYEEAKISYLDNLKLHVGDRDAIEKETVLQSESALWLELRRCLVTASNFGKICKRTKGISSAPLVKTMLYGYSLDHVPAIQHGKINESPALNQLARQENISIKRCGLFIDQEYFFIGASPDGLYNNDNGIIEIKCPKSAYGMSPDEAIHEKLIKIWKLKKIKKATKKKANKKHKKGTKMLKSTEEKPEYEIVLNKNHNWYYQVQGQLHITKKRFCLFGVWTGPDYAIKTALIEKDDQFWNTKIKDRLETFYHTCLLPEIVDSRKSRSMELRDTSY